MRKRKKEIHSKSLSGQAWQRLKRNKLSVTGMAIIGIAILIAILGPIIRPDSTAKANDQMVEITTRKPGFSVDLLMIRKNNLKERPSFWKKITEGKESEHQAIPIYKYWFEGADVVVEKYTGDEVNNGEIKKYNLAEVLYPLDHNEVVTTPEGFLDFYSLGGGKQHVSIQQLIDRVKEENLVTRKFYLGTDKYGRDMLSRLMAGAWISLLVGFIAVAISLLIGISLGALAGYYRGWIDDVIMWFINVVWSIPTLLLVIAITLALGKGMWQVFVAVGLTMWVEVARVVRGQIMSIREYEFVEAGRALGFTSGRIIFKHIIPNVLGPVIVISAINFAAAILIEAGLSYLGVGAQPPQATWGKMISDHRGYIITGDAYLALLPGVAIIIMVLAFVLVGNGLRDALDTKSVDDLPAV